jgi:hypothetical protein
MIVAIAKFRLPGPISADRAREMFEGSAPKYLAVNGLVRKYYLLSEDGQEAGGVYLWRSREAAEAFFDDEWKRFISAKYGSPPTVTIFRSPVIVDGLTREISTDRGDR